MDRGAWQAIESGVSKSWTWLKWLSTHRCVHMCVCVSMQVCGELSISVYVCECVFFNVCVCCVSICVFAHMCLYALCVLLCVFVSMCVCARYYFWCDLLLMNGIRQIWQDTISSLTYQGFDFSLALTLSGPPSFCFDETSYHKRGTHMERNWGHSLWRTRSCQQPCEWAWRKVLPQLSLGMTRAPEIPALLPVRPWSKATSKLCLDSWAVETEVINASVLRHKG